MFSFYFSRGEKDHEKGLHSKLVLGKLDTSDIVQKYGLTL